MNHRNRPYNSLADWIRGEHITQSEAAERLGITEAYLSQILNGHRRALPMALHFSQVANIPVENLLMDSRSAKD